MRERTVYTELLLAQTGWLRRLARRLVLDPGTADDAVQDTLVLALERPPRGGASAPVLRAWLRQVLRGVVLQGARGARRRVAREARAARGELLPEADASQLVARAESAQLLVSALQELPEPDRSLLLLRHFEGLEPSELAAELGLSAAALRVRLARARERLRASLDRRHGGDRGAWLQALAPLAGLAPTQAVGGGAALTLGTTLMLKFALGAAAIVAALWFLRGPSPMPDAPAPVAALAPERGPEPSATGDGAEDAAPGRRVEVAAASPPTAPAGPPRHLALGADGLFRPLLYGRVTDRADGRPVAGATVRATWGAHAVDGGPAVLATTGADGRYELVLPARALLSEHSAFPGREGILGAELHLFVHCWADGYRLTVDGREYPREEPHVLARELTLERGADATGVRVRVLDPGGQPVAGASVALFDVDGEGIHRAGGVFHWAVTREDGWAEIPRRPGVATVPYALTRDGLGGRGATLEPGPEALVEATLRLRGFDGLTGVVRDAGGLAVPESSLELVRSATSPPASAWRAIGSPYNLGSVRRPWDGLVVERCQVTTDWEGRFRAGHLAPGDYWVRLADRTVHGPFPIGSDLELTLERRIGVLVRAVDGAGRVLRGADLRATNGSSRVAVSEPTDRLGYACFSLEPGPWRLLAQHGDAAPGWREVSLPRDAGARIDVVVDCSATPVPVALRVQDGTGAPLAGVRFRVQRLADDPALARDEPDLLRHGRPLEAVAPDGRWEVALRPGRYRVRAEPAAREDEGWVPAVAERAVAEGAPLEALVVERGGRPLFRWTGSLGAARDPRAVVSVGLRRVGEAGERGTTSPGGLWDPTALAIDRTHGGSLGPGVAPEQVGPLLPSGRYVARVGGQGIAQVEREFVIAPGSEIRVDVPLEPAP